MIRRGLLRVAFVLAVLLMVEVGQTVVPVLRTSTLGAAATVGFWVLFAGVVVVAYVVGVVLWRSMVSKRPPETSPRPGAGGCSAGARGIAAVVSGRGAGGALPRLHP